MPDFFSKISLKKEHFFCFVLFVIPLSSWIQKIISLYLSSEHALQFDTKIFYDASVLWGTLHQDPYAVANYAFPPITLLFWKLFSSNLSYATFFQAFAIIKGVAAICLVGIWRAFFVKQGVWFFLFSLLAFNHCLGTDLAVGNITIIESIFIYLGLMAFLKSRYRIFSFFILLASIWKLTPIVFLGLLLFTPQPKIRQFIESALGFIFYLILNYLFFPKEFFQFLSGAISRTSEGGSIAPSLFSFLREVSLRISAHFSWNNNPLTWLIPYLIFSIFVGFICFKFLVTTKEKDDGRIRIYFFIISYLLILPRVKDYSYVIAIPAAYAILQKMFSEKNQTNLLWALFILLLFPIGANDSPYLANITALVADYTPFILLFILWEYIRKVSAPVNS